VISSDSKVYAPVGTTASIDAEVVCGGAVDDWDWDWPDGFYDGGQVDTGGPGDPGSPGGDTDGDRPDYGPPFVARDLDGDDTWTNDYRDRVIDDVPSSSPGTPNDYSFGIY